MCVYVCVSKPVDTFRVGAPAGVIQKEVTRGEFFFVSSATHDLLRYINNCLSPFTGLQIVRLQQYTTFSYDVCRTAVNRASMYVLCIAECMSQETAAARQGTRLLFVFIAEVVICSFDHPRPEREREANALLTFPYDTEV